MTNYPTTSFPMSPTTSGLIEQIRDWLLNGADAPELAFDMSTTFEYDPEQGCGTACCIAGAAVWFGDYNSLAATLDVEQPVGETDYPIMAVAAELLELDPLAADALFVPSHKPLTHITPDEAADVLNHLLETGEIKWT